MAMIEDFYMAKSSQGQGSSISSLPAGSNLGQLDDLYYFVVKVWKALKVPESRREIKEKAMGNFGSNQTQIERDEIKFTKFIHTLQNKFATLFTELLYRQLLWKNLISQETLDEIKDHFAYTFATDSYYDEIKQNETLRGRMDLANQMENFIGKYFTPKDVAIKIFRMTEDEWETKQKEIKQYKKELADEQAKLNAVPGETGINDNVGGDATPNENPGKTPAPDEDVANEEKTKKFIGKK
jgi:hypothetical protein